MKKVTIKDKIFMYRISLQKLNSFDAAVLEIFWSPILKM